MGHYRDILKAEVKTLGWVVQDVWMPTRLVVIKKLFERFSG